jgi:hypothetical protein
MHWNVLILWMFGEIELTLDEVFDHHDHHVLSLDDDDIRHLPDWFGVISGAGMAARPESVREVAKADFISDTMMELEEYRGN